MPPKPHSMISTLTNAIRVLTVLPVGSRLPTRLFAGIAAFVLAHWGCAVAAPAETQFLAENQTAMGAMMAGMDVKPSGNVDRDFALMMIAHHKGAIDMARSELRHGADETLRRLAQGIVIEQQQEIAVMQRAIAKQHPPTSIEGSP
jgi:hypothetical protein